MTLTFDLLTLKSVWESHVSCGTSAPSFVLNGLSVFDLGPIYAKGTDGQTDDRRRSLHNAPHLRVVGIIITSLFT